MVREALKARLVSCYASAMKLTRMEWFFLICAIALIALIQGLYGF